MSTIGFATVNMIWIPYLQRTYGVGAAGLGLADAAMGAGMLASGALVGLIASRLSKTAMTAWGFIIEGVMYMTIIFLPAFPWVLGWQFLGGLTIIPMQAALTTIMQLAVPDSKRGRVGSSLSAAQSATALLAMGFATLFGDLIGLRAVFVIVGVFVLASGILGFWLLREPEEAASETAAAV
jgi:predicted MFS family arabinose efflux permease